MTYSVLENISITESSFIPMHSIEIRHNYCLLICAILKENSFST